MDINGVSPKAVLLPQSSPVVRDPAPVSRAAADPKRVAPPVRDNPEPVIEEQAPAALDQIVARAAAKARGGTRLRLDDATEQVVAQIVNTNNEVIRQIPPEEALRIAARFRQVTGLIFDQQV